MSATPYEKPEILPGDLIQCLKTGGQGIIRESSGSDTSWSIAPLPGASIKSAWWSRNEFRVVERGPAHQVWAAALLVQKEKDARRAQESDLDWVIANFAAIGAEGLTHTVVTTILRAASMLPNQTGLLLRGEIGLAAFQLFDIFRVHRDLIQTAMESDDPKAALRRIGEGDLG